MDVSLLLLVRVLLLLGSCCVCMMMAGPCSRSMLALVLIGRVVMPLLRLQPRTASKDARGAKHRHMRRSSHT